MNSINHTINNSLLSSLEETSSASNLMESGANVYSCCIFIFIISFLEEASDIVLFTVSASVLLFVLSLLWTQGRLDATLIYCGIIQG